MNAPCKSMTLPNPQSKLGILVGLLLAIHFALCATSIRHKSLTHDEPAHFEYGLKLLTGDSTRFDDSKMPISALNALAVAHELDADAPSLGVTFEGTQRARLVTALFSVLLGLLVFHWARLLYGSLPALLSLLVYVFEPNILAHGALITTDLFSALVTTLTLYCFWRFTKEGAWKWGIGAAVFAGLAQITKYTCILLYPILLLILLVQRRHEIGRILRSKDWQAFRQATKRFLLVAGLFVLVSLAVINVGFLFNRTFTPLRDYRFRSELFQSLQKLPVLSSLPLPLPYPYLEGLDWVRDIERRGGTSGNLYLLGERRQNKGFPSYYLVAFLFKVPLGLQVLFALAVVRCLRRPSGSAFASSEVFLLVPFLAYFIYFSLFYRTQVGLRHLLIVFPLFLTFAGSLIRDWETWPKNARFGVAALALCQILSVLSYHPHYIPYFNELVWNRNLSYKILADSNLDWGQDQFLLQDFLAANPGVINEPEKPVAERIVLRANLLTGVFDPDRYAWLRDNFEPVGNLGYSYLLFDIGEKRLRELGLLKE